MPKTSLGKYIVIQGTDGAGKTTQKDLLVSYLEKTGSSVVGVKEPGQTFIGSKIRDIVKDLSLDRSLDTTVDLMNIDRRELVNQVIRPNISNGIDVVADRNWISAIAYQCYGEGYDIEKLIQSNREIMAEFFTPSLTVILDVPVEISEERIKQRGLSASDFFESKGRDFFEKVRQGYLYAAERFDLHVIDGAADKQTVHDEIVSLL